MTFREGKVTGPALSSLRRAFCFPPLGLAAAGFFMPSRVREKRQPISRKAIYGTENSPSGAYSEALTRAARRSLVNPSWIPPPPQAS